MTTSLQSQAPSPRKLPLPSPRNRQIYLDYQVHGLSQTVLAEKYSLTQCRISQIIRRIDAWRLQSAISNPNAVPGSSLGPHDPEAPASVSRVSATDPSTLNLQLGTLNSPSPAAFD